MKVFLQSIICRRNAKYIIKKLRINKYRLFLICFNFTNLIRLYYITIDLIILNWKLGQSKFHVCILKIILKNSVQDDQSYSKSYCLVCCNNNFLHSIESNVT